MEKKERRRSSLLLFPVRTSTLGSSRATQATESTKVGTDALFYAIRNRNFALVKRLVGEGYDLECIKGGRTPLAFAAETGCEDAVRMLVQLGADVSSGPNGLDPPILVAAKAGDLEMMKLLLDLGADPDGKGTGFPYTTDTPLLVAAETGNEAMLALLLRHGAAIDLTPLGRLRPMLAAAVKMKTKVSRMLLQHGAGTTINGLDAAVRSAVLRCLPELELWEYASGSPTFSSLSELIETIDDFPSPTEPPGKPQQAPGLEYLTWEWEVPETFRAEAETGNLDLRNEVVLVEDQQRPQLKPDSLRCITVGEWIDGLAEESDRILAEEFLRHIALPNCYDAEIEDNTAWSSAHTMWKSLGGKYGKPMRIRINKNGLHIPFCDIRSPVAESTTNAFSVVDWLCRALQQAADVPGFSFIASKYRLERFAAIYDGTFGLPQYEIRMKIALEREPLPESKYGCWRRLFKSCHALRFAADDDLQQTIAEQPLTPRSPKQSPENFGRGLEMSFDLMVCLAAVESPLVIDGGVVFVGYETILVPTGISEDRNAVQFHLITHSKPASSQEEGHGQINPYSIELGPRLRGRSMKTDWLRSRRCFLGWCAEARINLGTRKLDPGVGSSSQGRNEARESMMGGYEPLFRTSTSQGAPGLVGASSAYRFTNCRREFTSSGNYATLLHHTASEAAAVYDSQERRCWLVPKLSLLLHMSHSYTLKAPNKPGDKIPYVEPHPDSADILTILEPLGDLLVFGTSDNGPNPLLFRQLLFGLNMNLLPLPAAAKPNTRQLFYGFEYTDIITTPGRGSCMKPIALPSSRSWLELLSSIPTIVTCSSLGDVITPIPPPSPPPPQRPRPNPLCRIVPRNQDFLTATIPVLSRLARHIGSDIPVTSLLITTSYTQPSPAVYQPVRITENGVWNVTGDPFQECPHDEKYSDICWERKGFLQRIDARPTNRLRKLVGNVTDGRERDRKREKRKTWSGMGMGMGMGISTSATVPEVSISRALPARGAIVFGR